MCDNVMCGDNRFQIIAAAKKDMLEKTNIETSEDEMKVLDNFLFRCWQMGWLEKYNSTSHAITEEVRDAAIDFFKYQPEPNRSRLIEQAILGAEWRYLNKDKPYEAMYREKDIRYPIPEGGRTYAAAMDCSAFEYGAGLAYEFIRRKHKEKV